MNKFLVTWIYDLLLASLYTWCLYQAYIYDAKTMTGSVLIYLVIYGFFTLMIRSVFDIIIMNTVASFSLLFIFLDPVIQRAGGYFDFQPILGIAANILIALVQIVTMMPLLQVGERFLKSRTQYVISLIALLAFSCLMTMFVLLVPISTRG
ncbi:hypothetical protein [Sporolactobacillus vineae]|uniref:hypothetical protein n=1 Tax=Sporolactobacillus vineae TaxID=444463 RepID=UPI000287DD07|nr:hypothetical protein [Sporolactobacillus vineae]